MSWDCCIGRDSSWKRTYLQEYVQGTNFQEYVVVIKNSFDYLFKTIVFLFVTLHYKHTFAWAVVDLLGVDSWRRVDRRVDRIAVVHWSHAIGIPALSVRNSGAVDPVPVLHCFRLDKRFNDWQEDTFQKSRAGGSVSMRWHADLGGNGNVTSFSSTFQDLWKCQL